MGKKISAAAQQKAAEELAEAMSSFDGVSADIDSRSSGTQVRHTVTATCTPESWRQLAEVLIGIFCRLLLNDYGNSLAGSGG